MVLCAGREACGARAAASTPDPGTVGASSGECEARAASGTENKDIHYNGSLLLLTLFRRNRAVATDLHALKCVRLVHDAGSLWLQSKPAGQAAWWLLALNQSSRGLKPA